MIFLKNNKFFLLKNFIFIKIVTYTKTEFIFIKFYNCIYTFYNTSAMCFLSISALD